MAWENMKIEKKNQLLVEGKDDESFFAALLTHLNINNIQIQIYSSTSELKPFLDVLLKTSNFYTVTKLAIIRDADENAESAFQSVCGYLKKNNLPIPKNPLIYTGLPLKIGIFILPDNKSTGMLETLCIKSVENDPIMPCVESYLECIKDKLGKKPNNIHKARLHAYLSSRDEAGLLLGQAAYKKHFLWEHPVFKDLIDFLTQLSSG